VRRALERAGGVTARGAVHQAGPRPIAHPFGRSRPAEGKRIRAVPVTAGTPPEGMGFLAGLQQYVVDGHFGLIPVIRARVAAAALARHRGTLTRAAGADEEFLVVPAGRLGPEHRQAVADAGLPVLESDAGAQPHPLLDRWAAVRVIERRREHRERDVAQRLLEAREGPPLVVDHPVSALGDLPGRARVVGVVGRHETLYLDGDALAVALTLPPGHRSSAFAWEAPDGPPAGGGGVTHSWYLRLWPAADDDLLHGLVRVEVWDADDPRTLADRVSGWLLADRAPIGAADRDWHRRLYPLYHVEAYLRAHAGGWR
jgi:hypothetical protein